MKRNLLLYLIIILLGGGVLIWGIVRNKKNVSLNTNSQNAASVIKENMKLSSSVFSNNQMIPTKYTCDAENINPPLDISSIPDKTQSLALIVDDPDAPMGTFTHWVVLNIKPSTTTIAEKVLPEGAVEGMTSAGKPGYVGPCPPTGSHHYHFKLFALDTTLSLSSSAKREEVEKAMDGHILDKTELIGLYSRH